MLISIPLDYFPPAVAWVALSLAFTRYVFPEASARWQEELWGSMSEDGQALAKESWQKAEFLPAPDSHETSHTFWLPAKKPLKGTYTMLANFERP